MTKEIFEHLAILSAHIAQQIVESEGIETFCKSPCDLAIICYNKRYVHKELIGKMLIHLSEFDFLERRGEVFVLEDKWRRVLPAKMTSRTALREVANQIYLFQEHIAKNFLEIVRNETQKIELSKLIYFLDTIDGSKALHNLRSEAISQAEYTGSPKKILDINYGLGYSAIQLASVFLKAQIYSMQLNSSLKEAYEYTIQRNNKQNLETSTNYPSEMSRNLIKEKVDFIFSFNPLGFEYPQLDRILNIASQVAHDGTKLLIYVPYHDQPKNTLIPEWLGLCLENISEYADYDKYKAALTKYEFEIDRKKIDSRFIIAYYSPT